MSNSAAAPVGGDHPQLALLTVSEDPASLPQIEIDVVTDSSREERRYRRLLARKERLGDLSGMASCYIQLGDLCLAQGDSEGAGDMYRKSLKLARAANQQGQKLRPGDMI
jgi:hypothetical protein